MRWTNYKKYAEIVNFPTKPKENWFRIPRGILHIQLRVETWKLKKAHRDRFDAFEMWCWKANASDAIDALPPQCVYFARTKCLLSIKCACTKVLFFSVTSLRKKRTTSSNSWSPGLLTAKDREDVVQLGGLTRFEEPWTPIYMLRFIRPKKGTCGEQLSYRRSSLTWNYGPSDENSERRQRGG